MEGEVVERIYKIRPIFASTGLCRNPVPKKGPQRCLEAFQYKADQVVVLGQSWAAVGEVSPGLIWWPSQPSINEDNGPSRAYNGLSNAMGTYLRAGRFPAGI